MTTSYAIDVARPPRGRGTLGMGRGALGISAIQREVTS